MTKSLPTISVLSPITIKDFENIKKKMMVQYFLLFLQSILVFALHIMVAVFNFFCLQMLTSLGESEMLSSNNDRNMFTNNQIYITFLVDIYICDPSREKGSYWNL